MKDVVTAVAGVQPRSLHDVMTGCLPLTVEDGAPFDPPAFAGYPATEDWQGGRSPRRLFVSVGERETKERMSEDMIGDARDFVSVFQQQNVPGLTVSFQVFPDENHNLSHPYCCNARASRTSGVEPRSLKRDRLLRIRLNGNERPLVRRRTASSRSCILAFHPRRTRGCCERDADCCRAIQAASSLRPPPGWCRPSVHVFSR